MSDPQVVFRTRFTTSWVILLIAALLIVWDVYARQYDSGTISEVVLSWARSHPIVPFALGVIGGHLFWPQLEKSEDVKPGDK